MKKMLNGEIVDCTPEEVEAINATNAAIMAELEATEYIYDRQNAYPSIGDQLDMIFKSGVLDGTDWAAAIQAVKDANPKPE
jgi:predicted phosphoribosyltransferase